MQEIHFFILLTTLVTYSWADVNQNKFPLCKICACTVDNNETTANVTCVKPIEYEIFSDYFWFSNATNTSIAYNSITINYNKFIDFNKVFPTSNLTYLNLANNNIFNISDSIFKNLQNMVVLILSYNDLEIIHPDAFRGLYLEESLMPLRSLKELRLDHNKLHSLNQDIFEHTTNIEILDLSFNPLDVIDHHTLLAIDNLIYLKELYLQYTMISGLPDYLLHTPKYIRVLDLSGNQGITKIPQTLSDAKKLERLFLNNTGFTNLTKENGFPLMPNLKVLHLCRNEHLHVIDRYALCGLGNLTELIMSDNIDLVTIADLAFACRSEVGGGVVYPPIKKLHIGNNKLAYLDSEIIARWDGLSELDIRENPWTCECENQWLIDDLMPIYLKIDETMAKQVTCAAPVEMKSLTFYDIYMKKSHMRCLDIYGHRPERDGILLVGLLTGLLIAIPAILLIIFAYQKRWFSIIGVFDKSPASYSRRFYSTSPTEDF
ncbi:chondroadherin-like [Diorhabda carinulata]|uniref:chondroadherin-like n=1 Tax=Diorhabda carinulata TaxID=1163345 RepID=UPI0025A06108|nr:chondroadherin-like [Diorhabda carinulata]